jgi:hypothetical protein
MRGYEQHQRRSHAESIVNTRQSQAVFWQILIDGQGAQSTAKTLPSWRRLKKKKTKTNGVWSLHRP